VGCVREKGRLIGQAHEPMPSDANEEDTAVGKGCIACHHFGLGRLFNKRLALSSTLGVPWSSSVVC